MATRSELLELARRMEREPIKTVNQRENGMWTDPKLGIHYGSVEWSIVIDALRAAAGLIPA